MTMQTQARPDVTGQQIALEEQFLHGRFRWNETKAPDGAQLAADALDTAQRCGFQIGTRDIENRARYLAGRTNGAEGIEYL